MTRRMVLAAVMLAVASQAAQAQTVKVEFLMGKVNLVAKDAALRAILTEWARVGGTRLVNPERLTGGPLTLELIGVPERQALDILLRDVGGYMLGPRQTLVAGVSAVDRLVVCHGRRGTAVAAGTKFPGAAPRPQIGRAVQRGPPRRGRRCRRVWTRMPDRDEPAVRGRQGGPVLTRTAAAPTCPSRRAEARPATPGNPFGAVQGRLVPVRSLLRRRRLPRSRASERPARTRAAQSPTSRTTNGPRPDDRAPGPRTTMTSAVPHPPRVHARD